jgi:hypothetical protein
VHKVLANIVFIEVSFEALSMSDIVFNGCQAVGDEASFKTNPFNGRLLLGPDAQRAIQGLLNQARIGLLSGKWHWSSTNLSSIKCTFQYNRFHWQLRIHWQRSDDHFGDPKAMKSLGVEFLAQSLRNAVQVGT